MCALAEDAKASVIDFGLVQDHLHANGTLFTFTPVCGGGGGGGEGYYITPTLHPGHLHVPMYPNLCIANECSISL